MKEKMKTNMKKLSFLGITKSYIQRLSQTKLFKATNLVLEQYILVIGEV